MLQEDKWVRDYIYLYLLLIASKLGLAIYNFKFYIPNIISRFIVIYIYVHTAMEGIMLFIKFIKIMNKKKAAYLFVFLLVYLFTHAFFILSLRSKRLFIVVIIELIFVLLISFYRLIKHFLFVKKDNYLYKKVIFYMDNNKPEEALQYIEKYKQKVVEYEFYYEYIYLCLKGKIYKLTDRNKALDICKKAVDLYNQDEKIRSFIQYYGSDILLYLMYIYLDLIDILREKDEHEQLRYYNKQLILLVKEILSSEKYYYQKKLYQIGGIFYEYEYYNRAIKYLRKANCMGNNYKVIYLLGVSYFHTQKYRKALNEFNKLKNVKRYKMLVNYWIIRCNLELGNREKAFDYLIEATDKELDFYLKYRSLGDDYLSLQDKEKYLDFMKDRLEKLRTKFLKQSRKKKIIDVIIFLLFELDKDEEAYGYIKILQDLHPIYKEVYYWKVVLKIRKGDYESARRTYKEALKRYSDFFEMYDWVETNLNREKVKEILKV